LLNIIKLLLVWSPENGRATKSLVVEVGASKKCVAHLWTGRRRPAHLHLFVCAGGGGVGAAASECALADVAAAAVWH
jgi:hypothetical protein